MGGYKWNLLFDFIYVCICCGICNRIRLRILQIEELDKSLIFGWQEVFECLPSPLWMISKSEDHRLHRSMILKQKLRTEANRNVCLFFFCLVVISAHHRCFLRLTACVLSLYLFVNQRHTTSIYGTTDLPLVLYEIFYIMCLYAATIDYNLRRYVFFFGMVENNHANPWNMNSSDSEMEQTFRTKQTLFFLSLGEYAADCIVRRFLQMLP